jgi:zinc protease
MPWTLDVEHELAPGLTIRRHRLHNGLTLISLLDPAAPVVSYQTWFGVGSRHEEPGRTGMAHLFEHLMFNQTTTLAAGDFDRLIEQTGGDSNAATWVDWTYYRDTVPARDLALCVRLEADRMHNLVLEDGPLEAEREVVANERLQRVDDDVDGFLDEELYRLAFTRHPYRWPTIGWMDDIRGLAKPDVIRFYRTFYAPNNATVVVVGQFEPAELLALIEERYGRLAAAALPGGGRSGAAVEVEPTQTAERRASFVKPTAAPRLHMGWRAAAQGETDWAALSVAAALLASGSSSRLHRRLVIERELCSALGCDVAPFRDPGLFRLSLNLTRDASLAEVEGEIDSAIEALAAGRIEEHELAKVKNIVETDFWAELDTCDGRAEALGHYQTVLGDFRMLFEIAARLARVTIADVADVAGRYLSRERRCLLMVEPEPDDGDGDGDSDDDSDDDSDGGDTAEVAR